MLFSPLTINDKMTLRNRIVLAPLYLACDGQSEAFRAFYVRRAQGGVGLIIAPQSTAGGLADWTKPGFGDGFQGLIEGCHEAGAKIALQVFPGGGTVDEISKEQLSGIPEQYARAAQGIRDAGFGAIDIHGAHHSLFMRLLSPFQNHRTDAYGGELENRCRVQVETVRAIRRAVGEEFPILYRFSATDFVPDGVDQETTIPFAQMLEEAGVDCMDVSAGTLDSPEGSSHPGPKAPYGCFADLAAGIRAVVSTPVIAVGKIGTRDVAMSILEQGKADLVALGRPLIADPDWSNKLYEGLDDDVVPCRWENAGCLRNSIQKGKPIGCIQNEQVGHEHERCARGERDV